MMLHTIAFYQLYALLTIERHFTDVVTVYIAQFTYMKGIGFNFEIETQFSN